MNFCCCCNSFFYFLFVENALVYECSSIVWYVRVAKPFTIAQSSKGQQLVGIRISQNVRKDRKLMKPMVRFVGNMHGNEAVGREVLLHLSRHLLQGYEDVSILVYII